MKQMIPLQKIVWNKIRYYQRVNDIPNDTLAGQLKVHVRTLHDYDKKADNITLAMVDNFLNTNRITLDELMNF